jgi:hypothetical protein
MSFYCFKRIYRYDSVRELLDTPSYALRISSCELIVFRINFWICESFYSFWYEPLDEWSVHPKALAYTTQVRKTRTYIHTQTRVRKHNSNVRVGEDHTRLDCLTTGTGLHMYSIQERRLWKSFLRTWQKNLSLCLTKYHAMKAYVRSIALQILNLSTTWRWWSVLHPSTNWRVGWVEPRVWEKEVAKTKNNICP